MRLQCQLSLKSPWLLQVPKQISKFTTCHMAIYIKPWILSPSFRDHLLLWNRVIKTYRENLCHLWYRVRGNRYRILFSKHSKTLIVAVGTLINWLWNSWKNTPIIRDSFLVSAPVLARKYLIPLLLWIHNTITERDQEMGCKPPRKLL